MKFHELSSMHEVSAPSGSGRHDETASIISSAPREWSEYFLTRLTFSFVSRTALYWRECSRLSVRWWSVSMPYTTGTPNRTSMTSAQIPPATDSASASASELKKNR